MAANSVPLTKTGADPCRTTPLSYAPLPLSSDRCGYTTTPLVKAFFDEPTFAAIMLSLTPRRHGRDHRACSTSTRRQCISYGSSEAVIAHVQQEGLTIDWLLETHANGDNLSAAPYLQQKLGGKLAIGADIVTARNVFGKVFNKGTQFSAMARSSTYCCAPRKGYISSSNARPDAAG